LTAGSFRRLVRLTVRAGNDDRVAVWVLDPDFAMSWAVALALRRVAVRCSHNRRLELFGARDNLIKARHFAKPQQHAITDVGILIDKESVVVFDIAVMKLQNQSAAGQQTLILRTSMITAETQQLLVPAA
jgi:hypothetical protein